MEGEEGGTDPSGLIQEDERYRQDPSAPGSGASFMQALRSRPGAMEAFLRAVARGVLRRRPWAVRTLGYEQALDESVSILWVVTTFGSFQEALDRGMNVKQSAAYLARALENDLARYHAKSLRGAPLEWEPESPRSSDDPAAFASATDLAALLRRRLPARALVLLRARIAGGEECRAGGSKDGWGAVERALSLSSGTRKRLWTRVLEVLTATLGERRMTRGECILALRMVAGEARRGEARRVMAPSEG